MSASGRVAQPTFLERYRTPIVVVAALAGVALLSAFVFLSAVAARLRLLDDLDPDPDRLAGRGRHPGPRLRPAGHGPPACGRRRQGDLHLLRAGLGQPLQPARVGRPDPRPGLRTQRQRPARRAGSTTSSTAASSSSTPATARARRPRVRPSCTRCYDAFPDSPVCNIPKGTNAPVIARFDQMSTPFQAIVWGRVLTLDTLDQAKIIAFYQQWGEQTNPEKQCAATELAARARPGSQHRPLAELTEETHDAPRLVSR